MNHEQVVHELQERITKCEMGYSMADLELETLRQWLSWLSDDWDTDVHQPSWNAGYEARQQDEEVEKEQQDIVDIEEAIAILRKLPHVELAKAAIRVLEGIA